MPGRQQVAKRPFVVELDDEVAHDVRLTGGKAAALATAASGGLRALPGVVLTTAFCNAVDGLPDDPVPDPAAPPAGNAPPDRARGGSGVDTDGFGTPAAAPAEGVGTATATAEQDEQAEPLDLAAHPAVREAFERAGGDERDLVARSSSVVEDTSESSMAGQFDSVIGIHGFDAFVAAVEKVLVSRERAGAADSPIAVLVQPLIEPAYGGVLFGVDPVSGRSDRRVVSAVSGGPEPLVSGEVNGSRYLLEDDPHAIVVEHEQNDGPRLARYHLQSLVALSADVAHVFDGPQDVEWAIDDDDTVWLLQSRPVTTEIRGVPQGPIYGPGPVAETFPEPLTELEQDMWVPPLREAVREAVLLAGAATHREVDASQVVVTVDGHVAIDLQLAGEIPQPSGMAHKLNPVPAMKRVRGAWRVGRLRAALPGLAEHLLDKVDVDLEAVPALTELTSRQLLALLHRSRTILRALHAHEILMGMLTDTGRNRMTGASVALRVLVEARQDGLSDHEILSRSPIVLALTAPRVAPRPELPAEASALHVVADNDSGNDNGIIREALRLRVRWIQELSGRAAWALGERLTASGQLTEPELVRHMTLTHVEAVATKRAVVIPALVARHKHDFGSPLPAWFQMSDLGKPIRAQHDREVGGGTGAGGGQARGPVTYDAHDPPTGSVLVTTTLTPGLGPLLPRLRGIVAETGSVLSHLAILAREGGVATVVGYAGATRDLPEGATVDVNGETGCVTIVRNDEDGTPDGPAPTPTDEETAP
jgi:phosphohistidine swiveling domain-containing protein